MTLARFIVQGEERDSREVSDEWLHRASTNQENILLKDGNTYRIVAIDYVGTGAERHARVELVAPRFARGS